MKKPDTSLIDQDWPAEELEEVHNCPFCGGTEYTIAYENVQDWSFYCAPGKWTYWDCAQCEALYLNPRPTEASIGKAYASYYTHSNNASSIIQQLKTRLKNELFYHSMNAKLSPRLHVPKWLGFIIKPLKKLIHIPFELEPLVNLPKGKLLDVGCGSGSMLKIAKQLGWDVTGLEIDANAVKAARSQKLNVIEGDFHKLEQFASDFDCIICSHVLEHVHQPLELLVLLAKILKPHGALLLSLPNSKSHVRDKFGIHWRGIEAPRHLAIPTLNGLKSILKSLNYASITQFDIHNVTFLASKRILKNQVSIQALDFLCFKAQSVEVSGSSSDFIQLVSLRG